MTEEVKAKFLPDSDYERVIDVDYELMSEVQDKFNERWMSEVVD